MKGRDPRIRLDQVIFGSVIDLPFANGTRAWEPGFEDGLFVLVSGMVGCSSVFIMWIEGKECRREWMRTTYFLVSDLLVQSNIMNFTITAQSRLSDLEPRIFMSDVGLVKMSSSLLKMQSGTVVWVKSINSLCKQTHLDRCPTKGAVLGFLHQPGICGISRRPPCKPSDINTRLYVTLSVALYFPMGNGRAAALQYPTR